MKSLEILHLLMLQITEGIGDLSAKKLISYCGSAQGVIEEKPSLLEKIPGIGSHIIKKLKNPSLLSRAQAELDFINNNDVDVLTFRCENYPNNLKHCADGPILLFQLGSPNLNNKRVISIVGTRSMTLYGQYFLKELFIKLIPYDPIIISGLAYGIDIFAHRQALKYNLETVAVMAHGLDRVYPQKHHKEANDMVKSGGLLTEYWSKTNPDRQNFIKRNRIVAGLSEATIVIESALKGGSLITADIANSYNRDVFAVPGRTSDRYSQGCNHLIKTNRAALINDIEDLVYLLNWETKEVHREKHIQKQLFVQLDNHERDIHNFLSKQGKQTLDEIALNCKYPIQQTATLLLNLELKGLIKSFPGKKFETV